MNHLPVSVSRLTVLVAAMCLAAAFAAPPAGLATAGLQGAAQLPGIAASSNAFIKEGDGCSQNAAVGFMALPSLSKMPSG